MNERPNILSSRTLVPISGFVAVLLLITSGVRLWDAMCVRVSALEANTWTVSDMRRYVKDMNILNPGHQFADPDDIKARAHK